ncbi:MAG TPA: phosphate signaling complex protein PhoU [Terriglobia bacterium]|nr:phosphate signaling complex protein PhoU [Terriglobia bacterium]
MLEGRPKAKAAEPDQEAMTLRHLEEELEELRKRLLEMSSLVEAGLAASIQSLIERNEQHAQKVLRNEARINQMQIDIDEHATRLLALAQPVATDLRLITAAMKINTDLERMGDLAVNIAERSLSLLSQQLIKPPIDIPHLANLVESMVRKALDAFVKGDSEMARSVLASDDAVDALRDAIYRELIRYMEHDLTAVRQSIDLLFVVRDLERIADHATNIAEDVLMLVEGVDVRHHSSRLNP